MAFLAISTSVLLWQLSKTGACLTSNAFTNQILTGHVIRTVTATDFAACASQCGVTKGCHSFNVYLSRNLCELSNATHLSHPKALVQSPEARYMLYFPHPLGKCDSSLCGTGTRCVMNADGVGYRCKMCSDGLGVADNRIPDNQITGSSYQGADLVPWRGRLLSTWYAGAWAVDMWQLRAGEWLQVDIGHVVPITGVATQGRYSNDWDQWVTRYTVQYSVDGGSWTSVLEAGVVKEFVGNFDKSTVVENSFPVPVMARYVKFVVRDWNNYIAMRVEVYGCANYP
ncbi:lactadherin [Nematostella vectensis]|uniref:lactadherin n=1 Tax=Nematostella vectensis TaxID=45351 RepID=UPI0020777ABC|nr:lactadherin [Nematostella vectensis]